MEQILAGIFLAAFYIFAVGPCLLFPNSDYGFALKMWIKLNAWMAVFTGVIGYLMWALKVLFH